MNGKALTVLKEWREVIVLIAAVGGLYVIAPHDAPRPQPAATETTLSLYRLTAAVDSLNRRVSYLTVQIDALVRLQCAESDRRALTLSGVGCRNTTTAAALLRRQAPDAYTQGTATLP